MFRRTRFSAVFTFVNTIGYTADIEDHISEHGVSFHAFADDTQLYLHCRHDDTTSAVLRLENCINEVSHWMSANRLKLNTDGSTTELLWVGSRHGPAMLGAPVRPYGSQLKLSPPATQVRVLGVTLSLDLSADKPPKRVSSATCFHTGFDSSDGSDVHSTPTERLR